MICATVVSTRITSNFQVVVEETNNFVQYDAHWILLDNLVPEFGLNTRAFRESSGVRIWEVQVNTMFTTFWVVPHFDHCGWSLLCCVFGSYATYEP